MCKTSSELGWAVVISSSRCELWSMLSICSPESGLFKQSRDLSKGQCCWLHISCELCKPSAPPDRSCWATASGEGAAAAATAFTVPHKKVYLIIFDGHLCLKSHKTAFTNFTSSS